MQHMPNRRMRPKRITSRRKSAPITITTRISQNSIDLCLSEHDTHLPSFEQFASSEAQGWAGGGVAAIFTCEVQPDVVYTCRCTAVKVWQGMVRWGLVRYGTAGFSWQDLGAIAFGAWRLNPIIFTNRIDVNDSRLWYNEELLYQPITH